MANKKDKFSKVHSALRVEVFNKTQRKLKSIHRFAKWAAKEMYKEIRPTIVMHLVRGNSVFFKLDEGLELFGYISSDNNPFYPGNTAAPTFKMACPRKRKRDKLMPEDRKLFDKIYAEELAKYFNIEALDHEEYRMLEV